MGALSEGELERAGQDGRVLERQVEIQGKFQSTQGSGRKLETEAGMYSSREGGPQWKRRGVATLG